jgi:hypothetical protein
MQITLFWICIALRSRMPKPLHSVRGSEGTSSINERARVRKEEPRHALDGKGAEFPVLIADLPGIRECRRLAIRVVLLNAFPL